MKVPFVDLARINCPLLPDFIASLTKNVNGSSLILGTDLDAFESAFAVYVGSKYCIGVSTGLDALELSLRAAGIGSGDEVITVPNTFIATALAITNTGAIPVFVDVDSRTHCIDAGEMGFKINGRTKAIIPVHLYGRSADMGSILKLAKDHGLFVVEDACQAHGGECLGKKVGSLGDIGCFSFYPAKNLGCLGDGGAIVTNNESVARRIYELRNYGSEKKYYHGVLGHNARLDSIQAGFLKIKLDYLDEWNKSRIQTAARYNELLSGVGDLTFPDAGNSVFHLYVIQTRFRNELLIFLEEQGIGCGIHYPTSIHLQPAYRHLGYGEGSFPVAEKLSHQILSLPIFAGILPEEMEYVVQKIKEFFEQRR